MKSKIIILFIILNSKFNILLSQNNKMDVFILHPKEKKFTSIRNLIEIKDSSKFHVLDTNKFNKHIGSYDQGIAIHKWILLYTPNNKYLNKLPHLSYDPIEKMSFTDLYAMIFDTISTPSYDSFPDGLWYYYIYNSKNNKWELSYIKEVENYFLINVSSSFNMDGNICVKKFYNNGFIDSILTFNFAEEIESRAIYQKGKNHLKYRYAYRKRKLVSYYNTELGVDLNFFDNGMIRKYFQIDKFGRSNGNYYVFNELGEIVCQGVYSNGVGVSTTCED